MGSEMSIRGQTLMRIPGTKVQASSGPGPGAGLFRSLSLRKLQSRPMTKPYVALSASLPWFCRVIVKVRTVGSDVTRQGTLSFEVCLCRRLCPNITVGLLKHAASSSPISLCAVAAVAGVFIHLWARDDLGYRAKPPVKTPALWVLFLGYSNNPGGAKWARLWITNRDSCDLYFHIPFSLVWSNGPDVASAPTHVWLGANPLQRGSCCSMAFDVSKASGGPWRFWCPVTRHSWVIDLQRRLPHLLSSMLGPESGMGYVETDWRSQ